MKASIINYCGRLYLQVYAEYNKYTGVDDKPMNIALGDDAKGVYNMFPATISSGEEVLDITDVLQDLGRMLDER